MKYSLLTLILGLFFLPFSYAQPGESAAPSIQLKPAQTAIDAPAPLTPRAPAWMDDAQSMEQTSVEWQEIEHDFGDITEGEVVRHTFRFKNTGEHPLQLLRVKASCGCTTPSYTTEAVAPGAEGTVEVAFDSRGKPGFQNKAVTVTGNFEGTNMILRFKGKVISTPLEEDPGE